MKRQASLYSDLNGMLRGLSLIAQAKQSLPAQRVILPQRRVSKAQRETIERQHAKQDFEEREKADQIRFEQEMARQQMEAMREQQEQQQAVVKATEKMQTTQVEQEERKFVEVEAEEEPVVDTNNKSEEAFGATQQQTSSANVGDDVSPHFSLSIAHFFCVVVLLHEARQTKVHGKRTLCALV